MKIKRFLKDELYKKSPYKLKNINSAQKMTKHKTRTRKYKPNDVDEIEKVETIFDQLTQEQQDEVNAIEKVRDIN